MYEDMPLYEMPQPVIVPPEQNIQINVRYDRSRNMALDAPLESADVNIEVQECPDGLGSPMHLIIAGALLVYILRGLAKKGR